jgi:two-component system OmpR family response regulator
MAKILVVDDEPALVSTIGYNLRRDGHEVLTAADGVLALDLARRERPDLIVLDLMLPKMDGLDVCRAIRRSPGLPLRSVPILMLTARADEVDKVVGLEIGADDYVTKPFSHVVLVARLRALIRRGAGERPAVLEAGDLRFDPGTRRTWRGDIDVELTAREMALLEFLLRRKGDVVSKTDIVEHVWDYEFEGDLNIVEVYVRHLRNKLDRPFGRTAIETVRGAGYRLDPDGG